MAANATAGATADKFRINNDLISNAPSITKRRRPPGRARAESEAPLTPLEAHWKLMSMCWPVISNIIANPEGVAAEKARQFDMHARASPLGEQEATALGDYLNAMLARVPRSQIAYLPATQLLRDDLLSGAPPDTLASFHLLSIIDEWGQLSRTHGAERPPALLRAIVLSLAYLLIDRPSAPAPTPAPTPHATAEPLATGVLGGVVKSLERMIWPPPATLTEALLYDWNKLWFISRPVLVIRIAITLLVFAVPPATLLGVPEKQIKRGAKGVAALAEMAGIRISLGQGIHRAVTTLLSNLGSLYWQFPNTFRILAQWGAAFYLMCAFVLVYVAAVSYQIQRIHNLPSGEMQKIAAGAKALDALPDSEFKQLKAQLFTASIPTRELGQPETRRDLLARLRTAGTIFDRIADTTTPPLAQPDTS